MMNEGIKQVRFRFLKCEGFAFQADDTLQKLTEGLHEITTEASMVYVLTERGKIKCSVPSSKEVYESLDNRDRRQINIVHDFYVLWDVDGSTCNIFYNPKKKKRGFRTAATIIASAIGGAILSWIILILFGLFIYMIEEDDYWSDDYSYYNQSTEYVEPESEYPEYIEYPAEEAVSEDFYNY